jgi:hypothetical protein
MLSSLFVVVVVPLFLLGFVRRGDAFTLSMNNRRGERITNPYEKWIRQNKDKLNKNEGVYPLGNWKGGVGGDDNNNNNTGISTRFFPLSRSYHENYLQRREEEEGEGETEPFLHIKIYKRPSSSSSSGEGNEEGGEGEGEGE